jgi:hypothetical protein
VVVSSTMTPSASAMATQNGLLASRIEERELEAGGPN